MGNCASSCCGNKDSNEIVTEKATKLKSVQGGYDDQLVEQIKKSNKKYIDIIKKQGKYQKLRRTVLK